MRRILEELYHGNITPNVKLFIKDTEYSKAIETVSKSENALIGTIFGNKKAEKLLDDLMKAQDTVNSITGVENFIEGFRLGTKIGIEVMSKDDGCFVDIG